ncbi:hypothetical protein CTheo_8610 [Ceratobasidium theobromae]|uniref:Uncharacterized protein n=1 Tax=Ceratobasidium theobromae TaxID=1582974 RepID=A0A5N5Q948_9AGAM|nr:hypothetical protein CTheo_8610 [Ceratobasidium theobromae]
MFMPSNRSYDMSTYMPDHTFTHRDIMSSILDPAGRPMPTRGRLMGFLSTAMDKTVAGCCHRLVGLIEAAFTLFSPPVCEDPDGEVQLSIPGSYDLEMAPAPSEAYQCGCSICARRDGSTDRDVGKGGPPLVEVRVNPKSDSGSSLQVDLDTLPSSPVLVSGAQNGPSDSTLEQPLVNRHPDSTGSTANQDGSITRADHTVPAAVAPFFERKARPESGELNRQILAKYTESQIRMPKLKPLRLRSTVRKSKSAVETVPRIPVGAINVPNKASETSNTAPLSSMHAVDNHTTAGLALDTIAVAMTPGEWNRKQVEERTMACLKLPKLKTFGLKPSGSVIRALLPLSSPSKFAPTFASSPWKRNQRRKRPCDVVVVITPPNEDTIAAPGFSRECGLARRGRVTCHKVVGPESQNERQAPTQGSPIPETLAFGPSAPSTTGNPSSKVFKRHEEQDADLEDADLSPFYFDQIPALASSTSEDREQAELDQDNTDPEDTYSFFFDNFLDDGTSDGDFCAPAIEDSYTLQDEIISLYSSSDDDSDTFSPYPTSDSGSNTSDEIVPLYERVYAQL